MEKRICGDLAAGTSRFAIVVSRFNEFVTRHLLSGARDALRRHGASEAQITEVWVPGSWELATAARALIETKQFDAVICLGCVIRGQTSHHEHVAGQAARSLSQLAVESRVPVAFGVLTTDTLEQAIERAGSKAGNKGADAALTAIEMTNVLAQVRALAKSTT